MLAPLATLPEGTLWPREEFRFASIKLNWNWNDPDEFHKAALERTDVRDSAAAAAGASSGSIRNSKTTLAGADEGRAGNQFRARSKSSLDPSEPLLFGRRAGSQLAAGCQPESADGLDCAMADDLIRGGGRARESRQVRRKWRLE